MSHAFKYGVAPVRDIRVFSDRDERTGKTTVRAIEVGGEAMTPTGRFWRSFFSRFGISDNVFKYFDHEEVFQRVSERVGEQPVRYCVERDPTGRLKLLAVSNPDRPFAHPAELKEVIRTSGGQDVKYHEGIVVSTHAPPSGERSIQIGGDEFNRRFVLETPVDGYGNPRIYLSMLRLVCLNGMIGYAPAFRSEIRTGNAVIYSIARALETYDNGEGYAALQQRFQSAQSSWASLNEVQGLYKLLVRQQSRGHLDSDVLDKLYRVAGNPCELYGLANLESLSVKRQRVLPARCRVYDMLNFASELATHHAQPVAARALQAYVGTTVSDEYDMEGTAEKMTDFNDFFATRGADGRKGI